MKADNQYHKLNITQTDQMAAFLDRIVPTLNGLYYHDTGDKAGNRIGIRLKEVASFKYNPVDKDLFVTLKDMRQ